MSAREEERGPQAEPRTAALALLRERFPEPWELREQKWRSEGTEYIGYSAAFGDGERGVDVYALGGTTEADAAQNLIAAWDEATKGERALLKEAHAFSVSRAIDNGIAAEAERQLCDRLAEALADCGEHQRGCPWARFEAGRPTESGGYEMQYAGKWYEVKPNDCRPACTCGLNKALAAHAERRKA